MRLAVLTFLTLLLSLAALAGTGCKRPVGGVGTGPVALSFQAAQVAGPVQQAEEGPAFVFCHPHDDARGMVSLSAAAAQVAYDTQANNDDRTEMIAFEAEPQQTLSSPHAVAPSARRPIPLPWVQNLLRPPRPHLA